MYVIIYLHFLIKNKQMYGKYTIPRDPIIFSDDDWDVQSPPQHSI